MATKIMRTKSLIPACVLLLSGCGGMNVWPFDGEKSHGPTLAPSNATLYQCDGGKHFYLRYIDTGNTAWLIYPDREVALAKGTASAAGTRYSNGIAVLEIKGNDATLTDGPAISFTGCKLAGK
ncbi:MAG TPA: MliC family protein [Novimethylophilus sp.]|jgi:membrane-bound inhibitor of C-type lysozyme|uniref:MliC family protein n=1 Tax=Novimethylophilus sp. TaxID=2137426 RepID=UPI002F42E653